MFSLLISLLSRQSVPACFMICINLVHFMWSDAFSQSVKQARDSSAIFRFHSDITLSIPVASLVAFPLLNRDLSPSSTSLIFLSIFLLSILTVIFAVCAMSLIVRQLLYFVALGFFFKFAISIKFLGHPPVSYMLLISVSRPAVGTTWPLTCWIRGLFCVGHGVNHPPL